MPKSFRDSLFIPDPPTVVRVRGEPIWITRAGIRREGEPGAARFVPDWPPPYRPSRFMRGWRAFQVVALVASLGTACSVLVIGAFWALWLIAMALGWAT